MAAAKEAFMAAFAKAEAGEHAALAPAAVATAYLADEPEVAAAKAEFQKVFDAYSNGEIPAPVAPAAPVAAPVVSYAAYPQYYNNWNAAYNAYGYNGAYYNNWAGYGAYPYAHAAYPYAHAGYPYAYAGYPYTVQVAPAKAE